MNRSVDTKLRDLVADERARQILREHFPEWRDDPQVHAVASYSLREIASYYPESGISPQRLDAVNKALKTL